MKYFEDNQTFDLNLDLAIIEPMNPVWRGTFLSVAFGSFKSSQSVSCGDFGQYGWPSVTSWEDTSGLECGGEVFCAGLGLWSGWKYLSISNLSNIQNG